MDVNTAGPLKVQARVLKPPTLRYGQGSKQLTIAGFGFIHIRLHLISNTGPQQWCLEHVRTMSPFF